MWEQGATNYGRPLNATIASSGTPRYGKVGGVADTWLGILRAMRERGCEFLNGDLVLYSDGRHLHGSMGCSGVRDTVRMPPKQAIADGRIPEWCNECGGWQSTRFGRLLRACGEAVVSIERDQAGESDQTWDELWRRLQRHDEKFSILRSLVRGDDENTRAVIEEGMRAELSIAQRSRSQLNPRRLEGMLAAHGIRVELSAGSLPDFAAWLRGQRLQQQRAAGRADATHGPYDALLEKVLGASNPTSLAYVAEGPHSGQQLDGGVPAELALWLWALGHAPATGGVFLHVPVVVGDGILNLSGRNPRVHVSDSDEQNLDVLEVAKTLLRDAQESPSGLESVSLESVVANARLLLG